LEEKKLIAFLLITFIFIFLAPIASYADMLAPESIETLNVAVDPSIPPFQLENGGELYGLNIDILNLIALDNSIRINYIPMNKEVSMEKLINDEVDLILGIRYNPALTEKIDYSESIVQSVVCMLAKSEIHKDIRTNLNSSSYLASVENNSVELNFLRNVRRVNYNVAFSQEDAFLLLMLGRADFFLGVKDTAEYLLNKNDLTKEYIIIDSYMTPVEYFIASRPEDTKLMNLINYGLSKLKLNGKYEELYYKWVENSEANIRKRLNRVILLSIIVAVASGITFLIIAFWNINLKHQVNLQTKELSKINSDLKAQIIETKNNIELKNLICESSPRGIVIFDLNGTISNLNNSALAMAAMEDSPVNKSIYDIEPMNLMIKDTIDKVLRYKTSYTCDEFRYVRKDKEFIYRYIMYPLHDFEERPRGIIITIEDITEEKKIKNQINQREKNRVLTQLIAGISHEIRNPLTTIKTFIELLPAKMDNIKFRKDIAVVVPEEIERVDKLIESLIDYAKPKSQNKSSVSIKETISSCVNLFNPVLEQHDIGISINIDESLHIYCDKSQVKQAVINFLLNSIDAIIEKKDSFGYPDYKGNIRIEGFSCDNETIFKIHDNGIGMDSSELEKAFDIFYTTKEKGTGLGIPLSVQMLDMNNCKVSIDSRKSEFTIITLSFSK
jgi:polar amino acid transport system substrate-binding protein